MNFVWVTVCITLLELVVWTLMSDLFGEENSQGVVRKFAGQPLFSVSAEGRTPLHLS